jgi:hypothetical protein
VLILDILEIEIASRLNKESQKQNKLRKGNKMKYAHIGDSTDNAMTVGVDGQPIRTFIAFPNAKDRKQFQDDTWKETGGMRNVIFCTRKDVEKYFGKNFVITTSGIMSFDDYETLQMMEQ